MQINDLWQSGEESSFFLAKGVDGFGVGAYSSPPQLTQRTKQRKRNGSAATTQRPALLFNRMNNR
ncbi:hypothetical protein CV_1108 [Chromobacterium violaceum ATCC 12472]|uniref:Uncharacterized protein n=1 Tax=Chromobacterium violaceum (strain ATCC 12472 / DSM 30191 / JCM 1249 / CCUG 213 / NBRC 12614 / NCIMB 9131 / NCTC 9757 / MK) TaxID=243365 RepID=Q7NZ14_CHRVO|nr:hypothetical protein CV_1108 [Chromobacterium violaceum ATCC 12472]